MIDSLQQAVEIIDAESPDENDKCGCFKACCVPSHSSLAMEIVPPEFSIPYKIGLNMSRELFLPAMPYLLRDIWILIELLVTVVQVVLAAISIPNSSNLTGAIVFICLATLNALLALLDATLYYYELGAYKHICKRCINAECRFMDVQSCGCVHLSEKKKALLKQWFEIIRTVLSELLLYPLIIFDLYDVGRTGFINSTLDFSIFLISSFYMVLSVYLARILITIFTLKTLLRLLSKTTTGLSNIRFVARFFGHVIAQIVVHLSCILAVGLKIHQENANTVGFNASVFLWVVMIGGWIIPFVGIIMFFVANYFWTQQYSIGFCIEMLSLIQVPNIAQSLFKKGSEIEADALQKSQEMLKKMQFSRLKEDYCDKLKKAKTITKIIFPGKVYLFILLAFVYSVVLVSFFVCLFLGIDENGRVFVLDINQWENVLIVSCIVIIAICNVHILLLTPCLPQISLYALCRRMKKGNGSNN